MTNKTIRDKICYFCIVILNFISAARSDFPWNPMKWVCVDIFPSTVTVSIFDFGMAVAFYQSKVARAQTAACTEKILSTALLISAQYCCKTGQEQNIWVWFIPTSHNFSRATLCCLQRAVCSLLAGRETHMHTRLLYLSLLFKTTSLSCKKMLSVLFWLLYKHLHKLIFGGEKKWLRLF